MPRSKFFLNPYLFFGIGVSSSILLHKKRKRKKRERSYRGNKFFINKHSSKYSQCPAFDIKQSPAGWSPEDRQSKSHGEINI